MFNFIFIINQYDIQNFDLPIVNRSTRSQCCTYIIGDPSLCQKQKQFYHRLVHFYGCIGEGLERRRSAQRDAGAAKPFSYWYSREAVRTGPLLRDSTQTDCGNS